MRDHVASLKCEPDRRQKPSVGATANSRPDYQHRIFAAVTSKGKPYQLPTGDLASRTKRSFTINSTLGANDLDWISRLLRRRVQLGIAYDPSRKSAYVQYINGEYVQYAPNFDKIICYYNPSTWFFGGSKYVGSNVEIVPIDAPHLDVPYVPALEERTIAAVRALAQGISHLKVKT